MASRIKDPALYQIIYLLSWHAFENEREFEWHKAAIKDFLFTAWEKANPAKEFPEAKIKKFSERTHRFLFSNEMPLETFGDIRLFSTGGWVKAKDMSRELDVRSFDDTSRIHLTYLMEGESSTEVFNRIRSDILRMDELVKTESGRHAYIGEVYYPAAEIGKGDKERDCFGNLRCFWQQSRK